MINAGFFSRYPKSLNIKAKLSLVRSASLVSSILKKAKINIAKLTMVKIRNIAFQFETLKAYPPIKGARIVIIPLTTNNEANPFARDFPLC